ncbi:hypothetical protein EV207_1225 [Scopulibacillus darangshiensis]|uniref:Lipase (Class 3) n=1 Tax=Scopulibacillus darangshiensis TaxID=442528 RepID=A0A4R2NSY3_9BACL|nr:hypothetical protein [Scopulibacillus darangshiensis]TCP24902.1 hypothetical protein EV207_1225 [Scopulibacillus darangshiensis]
MPQDKVDPVHNIELINNDKDLVELAGYHAYKTPARDKKIVVNGYNYRVIDINYNGRGGLDALTVVNTSTDDISIVFVGTADNKDKITDAQLLSDVPPAQIKAAKKYFNDMKNKYEKNGHRITSVTGNSLGGGLANAVGIEHSDVKVVTLNPALLPDNMIDPDKSYDNITNYFSQYDPLTLAEKSAGLGERIPGKHYIINNGIAKFSKLGTNHTGYIRGEGKTGEKGQFYTIGVEGEPGFGRIYIAADDSIVTSIWTGKSLYRGGSGRIDINYETLNTLSIALHGNVTDRLKLVQEYLGHSVAIVDEEQSQYRHRVSSLQETFSEAIESSFGYGIAVSESMLRMAVDKLISLLNVAEGHCKSLNAILNSPPAELIEKLTSTDISVESIFRELKGHFYNLKDHIDDFAGAIKHTIHEKVPALFENEKFTDAIVGELKAHYDIIAKNKDAVLHQLTEFQGQVKETADAFKDRDEGLAGAIKTNASPGETKTVQRANIYKIEESPYMLEHMRIKQLFVDFSFSRFKNDTHVLLIPLLNILETTLFTIENGLEILSATIKGAAKIAFHGNLVGSLISKFTSFDDKIKGVVNKALEPLDEIAADVEGIRNAVGSLITDYPTLLANFKPYFDNAAFQISNYHNVYLYNQAALSILEEMALLFSDIVSQLSHHEAKAIDTLCDISKSVKGNMQLLDEQIARGTLI